MRTVTPALTALLLAAGGRTPLVQADFYTFTLTDGTQLRYGTGDFPITAASATIWNPPAVDGSGGMWVSGIKWEPSFIDERASRSTAKWKVGLDSDVWDVRMAVRAMNPVTGEEFPDRIGGQPWLQAARSGALDGADMLVSRAYYAAMPTLPFAPAGESPVGTIATLFRGLVGPVRCSDQAAYISATDYRALLDQQMPRQAWQASCRHRLYDSRCGLLSTDFDRSGIVAAAVGALISAASPLPSPGGSDTFELGTMTMTSGANDGFSRLIQAWDGATSYMLLNPFLYDPVLGDTFIVTAGCDKSTTHCAQFANTVNFGGSPWIPIPEVSLG